MVDLALEHAREAGAAHALFARRLDLAAMGRQHLDDGLLRSDGETLAGAGEADVEGAVVEVECAASCSS